MLNKIGYFIERYTHSKNSIKVEVDLSNYATKSYLKRAACINATKFAKMVDLANLKSDFDYLDIDKWKAVPVKCK